MGNCHDRKVTVVDPYIDDSVQMSDSVADSPIRRKSEWKVMHSSQQAREKFEADGTLSKNSNPEELELRAMIDEPVAQAMLGKFAKDSRALDIFMCWVDIQEYKSIPTADYRRSKALHIFHKYIKEGAILEVAVLSTKEKEKYEDVLNISKSDPSLLDNNFYEQLQFRCFKEVFYNVFLPFKSTPNYNLLVSKLKEKYNTVRPDDFDFMGKLGEGGFGLVVLCRKKSTAKYYAMKIQTKLGLLNCFSDDPLRVDFEKQAFASCQHPFIVNLDYAFQTESLAIMVLGLATAGDLQKALQNSRENRLDERRVQFYAAEIVLALAHLHQMGLMYRDLKPNNVLLHDDGHIMLVDLGGVMDEKGLILGQKDDTDLLAPLFSKVYTKEKSTSTSEEIAIETAEPETPGTGKKKRPVKRQSIMGTFGYMAPEMVIMIHQRKKEKVPYTYTVDYWSLGVTMYKMLTGVRPFSEDNFEAFMSMASSDHPVVTPNPDDYIPEYSMLFNEIMFPSYVSKPARDIIRSFLNVDGAARLGSVKSGGLKAIQNHPFFDSIDWDLLGQKHMEPPFKPDPAILPDTATYPSFRNMLTALGKTEWLDDAPNDEGQKFFKSWDFLAPMTMRIEAGIANEMEQFDRKTKVRQLMGEKMGDSGMGGS